LKQQEQPFSKLVLVTGDMQQLDLGISPEDQTNLINDVEIVFHAAADVRFDESLKEATEINIRGTREMMLLSQRMVNLNVFIYVSTAFCTPGFDVRESCELFDIARRKEAKTLQVSFVIQTCVVGVFICWRKV
jgi:thioester reductase-like protein